jgi:hypothetical protein
LPKWKGVTCDDAVKYILDLDGKYTECSERHTALAKAVQ